MDSQDQPKSNPSGHESHGVYLCNKCGWPFPNPHPSAKHRRAHRRICGTVEGNKMIDSGEHAHSALSDDEHGSDEDRRTPSPKIAKSSADGGFSPVHEVRFEGAQVSDKSVENVVEGGDPGTTEQLKVESSAGIHLPNSPTDSSEVHNPKVLETETNLLGNAIPLEDIVSSCNSDSVASSSNKIEELAAGLDRVKASAGDLSDIKSETWIDFPKADGKENVADSEMQSSAMHFEKETEIKGNEESNADEVLCDGVTPNKTVSESSEVASILQEKDLKTSDSPSVDQIVEPKEEHTYESGPTTSPLVLSPEVRFRENMEEVLVDTTQIESESSQDRDASSHSASVEASYTRGDGNENVHVLSVSNDITPVDHPEVMIQDFKDHKARQSNLPMSLDSLEVTEAVEDDKKDAVYEDKFSSFHPDNSGENIQEDGGKCVLVAEVPVEKEEGTSEFKVSSEDVVSNGVEAPPVTTVTGNGQTDSHLEGQKPHDFDTDSSQEIMLESSTMGLPDVISVAISADDEVSHGNNFSGGDNACNHKEDRNEKCLIDGKETMELPMEELSTNLKSTSVSVNDLVGNENRDVALQEKPEMNSKMTTESACSNSKPKESIDCGMDKFVKNSRVETTSYLVSDSSEGGPDTSHLEIVAQTHSGLQNQLDEDSQEAMKEPNHHSGAEVSQKIAEISPEGVPVESDFTTKSSATVDDSNCKNGGSGASGIMSEKLQEEGHENLAKQPTEVSAVDVSVDSISQTDSLEGNWGSVSVLSTQSDAVATIDSETLPSTTSEAAAQSERVHMETLKTTSEGHCSGKSDDFEAPSFMTLVEPREMVDKTAAASDIQTAHNTQQPKSDALQAGWFPSLTNVVNDSQGRKKNEEIMAKVTNWSTGKQHTPLQNLLGEASVESKQKSLNPKTTSTVTKNDENTTTNSDASVTTVNLVLGQEVSADQVAKREMGKEWNSPARYPSDNKKEKKKGKGRPTWVPFLCCSSVN